MNEALLAEVQKELRIQNKHNSYPFFHCVSNIDLTNADTNSSIVKRILDIAQSKDWRAK